MIPARYARPKQKEPALLVLLLLLAALFVLTSLLRTRQFPYDAMNYIGVAEHLTRGEGLVQTTVGMFQPHLAGLPTEGPVPFVAQGPLYPVLIAGLNRAGVALPEAALALSALAYMVVVFLGYRLARRLYGRAAGRIALAGLLVYAPLVQAGRTALTEAVAAALLLAFLQLLCRGRRRRQPGMLFLAGLVAGLAFATRYALVGLIPLGACWIIAPARRTPGRLLAFLLGAGTVVLPVLLHNRARAGAFLVAPLASDQGLVQNSKEALLGLLGNFLVVDRQQGFQTLLSLLLLLALLWRGRTRAVSPQKRAVRSNTGALLLLWAALYTVQLVLQRSRVHFDPLDSRLLLPAGVVLVVVGAGLVARTLAPAAARRTSRVILLVALLFALGRELRLWRLTPEAPALVRSPRLRWLARHTTPQDYLIGDDAMDLPFFLKRTRVLSVSPYPYNERLDRAVLQERMERGTPLYLVLRRPTGEGEAELTYRYGSLIAALKQGTIPSGIPLETVARLDDAFIYRAVPDAPSTAPR